MSIQPLADDYVTVYESPDPDRVFCYSPGIARMPDGCLIATMDLGGPGVVDLPGSHAERSGRESTWQGRIYTSDDQGRTWDFRATFPFLHARPFVAGDVVYVLGHAGDLMIIRSDDNGETWHAPVRLTEGETWHQAPCNVHYAHGCIYLVMEKRVSHDIETWAVGELAPVLMRGRTDADLTHRGPGPLPRHCPSMKRLMASGTTPTWMISAYPSTPVPIPAGLRSRRVGPARPLGGWRRTWCVSPIRIICGTIPPDGRSISGCGLTPGVPGMRVSPRWSNIATKPVPDRWRRCWRRSPPANGRSIFRVPEGR